MHLAVLVVGQRILLQTLRHQVVGNDERFALAHRFAQQIQDVQQFAGIATAEAKQGIGFPEFYLQVLQHDVFLYRTAGQFQQVVAPQALQHIHLAAAQQGTDDLERRVLRGGTNQRDDALLDGSQQAVLLRLRETVDFIDEQDGAGGVEEAVLLGTVHHLAHVLHTARHGRQRVEGRLQLVGNNRGQRGLAHSRRSPQDETGDAPRLYHAAQHGSLADQMLLADVVVERRRAHSFCQWCHIRDKVTKNFQLSTFNFQLFCIFVA